MDIRLLTSLFALAVIAVGRSALASVRETKSPWFSVDPVAWSEDEGSWNSDSEEGSWSATPSITRVRFSGNGNVGRFSGVNVDLRNKIPESYDIYIHLDGATAEEFLGDGMNYGEASWEQTDSSILSYEGESKLFAITFQPTSFDEAPLTRTFSDLEDQALYEALMETYGWTVVQGIPTALPSFFAIGFNEALNEE